VETISPRGSAEPITVPDASKSLLVRHLPTGEIGTQLELATKLLRNSLIDEVFDDALISTYISSSHAPLVGTVIRGTIPLFPGSSLVRESETAPEPILSSTPNDAINTLSQSYSVLASARKINLFFSSGWDSRVELAQILQFVPAERIELFHFDENEESTQIVREVSDLLGIRLTLLGSFQGLRPMTPEELDRASGGALTAEPIVRPTVYFYGAVMRDFKSPETVWVGFTPWELKGRYLDRIPMLPPDQHGELWRLRPVRPEGRLGNGKVAEESLRHQHETWRRIYGSTAHLVDDQRQDYANWALSYGLSYSNRMRVLSPLSLIPIGAQIMRAKVFWGLPREQKTGHSFQRKLLHELLPELRTVEVLSSSDSSSKPTRKKAFPASDSTLSAVTLHYNQLLEQLMGSAANEPQSKILRGLDTLSNQRPAAEHITARQLGLFILNCARRARL
jgi:hypothetical protein